MARIRNKGGFAKRTKTKGNTKKSRRRDLEDLYHEVLESEKKTRQHESKKRKVTDTTINDDVISNVVENNDVLSLAMPSQPKDLNTLLSLLSDDGSDDHHNDNESLYSTESSGDSFLPSISVDNTNIISVENIPPVLSQSSVNLISQEQHHTEDLSLAHATISCSKDSVDHNDDDDASIESSVEDESYKDDAHTSATVKNNFSYLSFASFDLPFPTEPTPSGLSKVFKPKGFLPYVETNSLSLRYSVELMDVFDSVKQLNTKATETLDDALNTYLTNLIPAQILSQWNTKVVPKVKRSEILIRELTASKGTQNTVSVSAKPLSSSYLSAVQAMTVFGCINSYADVILSEESYKNAKALRALAMLHIVVHLYKTRKLLTTNNSILKKLLETQRHHVTDFNNEQDQEKPVEGLRSLTKSSSANNETSSVERLDPQGIDTLRDQGFEQARVLILAPTRCIAKELVTLLLDLLPNIKQVRYRKRFNVEFSSENAETAELRNDLDLEHHLVTVENKPIDYADIFRGNSDDNFHLGIKLHSAGVTLYAPFEESDIIVASPLGLKLLLNDKTETKLTDDVKTSKYLSSIEILFIDRCDVLKMQNWENMRDVLAAINLRPATLPKACDIRRLRLLFSENLARFYRQTIIFSNGRRPEINSLFSLSKHIPNPTLELCSNFRGTIKLHKDYDDANYYSLPVKEGALRVSKQLFMYVPCKGHHSVYNDMLQVFESQFPHQFFSINPQDKILIVVPTYVEYVRLRKILKSSKLTQADPRNLSQFRSCHENSSNRMLTASRQMFRNGEVKLLVTTERFLFYRRYYLRGADHIFFFCPPEYPELYLHCLTMLNNPTSAICLVFFTRYHALACERLLGQTQTKVLVNTSDHVPKVFVLN